MSGVWLLGKHSDHLLAAMPRLASMDNSARPMMWCGSRKVQFRIRVGVMGLVEEAGF